jgi:hypothetical protein
MFDSPRRGVPLSMAANLTRGGVGNLDLRQSFIVDHLDEDETGFTFDTNGVVQENNAGDNPESSILSVAMTGHEPLFQSSSFDCKSRV